MSRRDQVGLFREQEERAGTSDRLGGVYLLAQKHNRVEKIFNFKGRGPVRAETAESLLGNPAEDWLKWGG
jgi:hypothetical protein